MIVIKFQPINQSINNEWKWEPNHLPCPLSDTKRVKGKKQKVEAIGGEIMKKY